MVFFTCNACGESLKKAQVEKHVNICRGCEVLSCIDCGKDFWGNDYKNHVKCISEDQKYGGKGYEAKSNKGDVKQQQWIQRIHEAMNKPGISPKLKDVLNQVSSYDNVPRKKAKFQNWMKNSLKIYNTSLYDQVWDIFSEATSTGSSSTQQSAPNQPAESQAERTLSTQAQQNGSEEVAPTEKKKNKRERKEERQKKSKKKKGGENSVEEEPQQQQEDNTAEEQKKKKKRKKGEENGIVEEEDTTEKQKKKKKKKGQENGVKEEPQQQQQEEDITEKQKKKRKRKRGEEESSAGKKEGGRENGHSLEEETAPKRPKKYKGDSSEDALNTTAEEQMAAGDAECESDVKGKFNWKGTIKAILRQGPEEGVPVKKLKKKVLAAYYSFTGEGNHRSEEELLSLFNKKVNNNPKFRILKEKVRLVK
ncbi:cell growth-regulating nucleolar protein [Megalops cyprinoides]|uniref:cell growth-regulating nucleolar protein n=1 Tax=Megalops cyprinoides TaxID=118141 RepID=UPI001864A85C|nr:cell growth-regulating nucleolar protein [Megalops cyprinoides]